MAKPVVNVLAVSLRAGDEHLTPIFMKLLTITHTWPFMSLPGTLSGQ